MVVSKDADFVNSQAVTGTPAKLLRIRVGNTSNRVLFALMEQLLDDITTGFDHAAHIELHDSMLVIHTK